ncbi:sensor histidine kinase [uncultured Ornithinimicrobium sp.]|uniref:sensor histidine kinase n=1 Tax=uncultured Ornithinimicrobium sp. TaxID=259307 RepID=UPI0025978177|nr:histidine kinase [uncultured Ornithinimicrobium sp.]
MMRVDRSFGADEEWERPAPDRRAVLNDVWLAVLAFVVSVLSAELMRSLGAFENERLGVGWQYVGMVTAAALVVIRRSHPVLVTALAGVHMLVLGLLVPMTMSTLPMQALYFFLIFSGVAWARDRRALLAAVALTLTLMAAWLAWTFALGRGLEQMVSSFGPEAEEGAGLFSPVVGMVGYTLLVNVIFFGGAIVLGQVAWDGARRTAQVLDQARTIAAQARRLRDQAVVDERLRIARELHDVVAHHVSLMGVQAAAARRVMGKDPDAATAALTSVEQSSRDAVTQMRGLLGTLRGHGEGEDLGQQVREGEGVGERDPQPSLADLPRLAARATTSTCEVVVDVVEDPDGAAARVAPPLQLTAYRVVQEALANVHRHSTARSARAVVRVDEAAGCLEIEVVDDGTARAGTAGTGLGLLGMEERASHLGGRVEAGPRRGRAGWRVFVRVPLSGTPGPGGPGCAVGAPGAWADDVPVELSRAGADR